MFYKTSIELEDLWSFWDEQQEKLNAGLLEGEELEEALAFLGPKYDNYSAHAYDPGLCAAELDKWPNS